jgi:hypothetical protein
MAGERIEISGLKEYIASIKRMDRDLPKQVRLIFNQAGELVVDYARMHIARRTGAAASSIKVRSGQRQARIAVGGRAAPYAPWLDFGGEGRRPGRPSARPYMRTGRYVYKGLDVHRDDITKIMSEGMTELGRSAGLEVT